MRKSLNIVSSVSSLILGFIFLYSAAPVQAKNIENRGLETPEYIVSYCYQPSSDGIHQIYSIHLDGSQNKKIIESTIGLNHHDISPDGEKYAAVGYVGSDFVTWSIHIFNSDGTGLKRLTNQERLWDSEPAWSPDGTKIAFTRIYTEENRREELWLMNADGSSQHSIGIDGFAARWSPDGKRFIYVSKRTGNYEVYTCSLDGANEKRLTETKSDEFFPAFSPDGSRIAFCAPTGGSGTSENTSTFEIFTMNPDGSDILQLTDNEAMDSMPRWSPDGTRFLFCSDRAETNKWEVYVMNVDGTDVQRVTHSPDGVTAINPAWVRK